MEDASGDNGEDKKPPIHAPNMQNKNNVKKPIKIEQHIDNGFKFGKNSMSDDDKVFKLPAMPPDMDGPSAASNLSRKSAKKGCSYHLHDHISLCNIANQVNRRIRVRLTSRQRNYLINAMCKDLTLASIVTDPADQEAYDCKWNLLAKELNRFGPPKPVSQWQCVSREIQAKIVDLKPGPHSSMRPPIHQQKPPLPHVQPNRVEPPPVLNTMPPPLPMHSPPPSPPPEFIQQFYSNPRIEALFEEGRDALMQISSQQSNILERFIKLLDTAESRRQLVEERRLQCEERRLHVEERIANVLERLVSAKKV